MTMQAMAVNTFNGLPVAAPRQNRWLAYARAATFTVWFFSLVVNYWWRQEWDDVYEMTASGVDLKSYYYLGFFAALLGHLTLGPVKWLNTILKLPSTPHGRIMLAFFLYMLLLTPFSVNPINSAKYLAATLCVLVLCSVFWTSDYHVLRRALVFTGIVLFAWLLVLLVHHGMPRGFAATIGGINRNMIGKLAFVAMVCMLFSNIRALRWGSIGLAAAFLVLVTSRGSLLAMTVFLAAYYTLSKGTLKAAGYAVVGVMLVAFPLLASPFLQKAVFEDVLRVNDERRGIGSGLTGRVENWQNALQVFRERPLVGFGFRATAVRDGTVPHAHSGYLNILLETGVIGASLIVGAVIVSIIQRMRLAQQMRQFAEQDGPYRPAFWEVHRLNTIVVATLCAVMVLWVYEPLYINLGNVASILFFLMFASPKLPNLPQQHAAFTVFKQG